MTPGVFSLSPGNLPAPFYLKSAMMGGRDLAHEALPVASGTGPIDVAIADDGGAMQGRLEDANGDPAAGWAFVLRDGRLAATVPAAPDGNFKVSSLPPGDYRVFGWDEIDLAEWADSDWMRRYGGSGVGVTVSAGQTADVKLVRVTIPRD